MCCNIEGFPAMALRPAIIVGVRINDYGMIMETIMEMIMRTIIVGIIVIDHNHVSTSGGAYMIIVPIMNGDYGLHPYIIHTTEFLGSTGAPL